MQTLGQFARQHVHGVDHAVRRLLGGAGSAATAEHVPGGVEGVEGVEVEGVEDLGGEGDGATPRSGFGVGPTWSWVPATVTFSGAR